MKSPEADEQEELFFALHEIRDVNFAIESPAEFDDAEIRVISTGTVGLAGYEGRNELRWSTPLDRGTNMLRLPVAMDGRGGGHLLVEVTYGAQQKTFVVYLRERTDSTPASPESVSNRTNIKI
jgi:hypothetical protein